MLAYSFEGSMLAWGAQAGGRGRGGVRGSSRDREGRGGGEGGDVRRVCNKGQSAYVGTQTGEGAHRMVKNSAGVTANGQTFTAQHAPELKHNLPHTQPRFSYNSVSGSRTQTPTPKPTSPLCQLAHAEWWHSPPKTKPAQHSTARTYERPPHFLCSGVRRCQTHGPPPA